MGVVDLGLAADGFAIGHLRRADGRFDLVGALQDVDLDVQVQLAHALQDRLARLVVGRDGEGRVFRSQLGQGDAQLFLVGLGLGFHRDLDDRGRELHTLQDDRRLDRVAQGVAGAGVLQAGQGDDVAGVGFLDVLAVVGVHQQHAADAFLLVAGRVQQRLAGFHLAGIQAAEGQRADEGVVHDLERQDRQRLVVRRLADNRLFGLEVDARGRRDVDRRRQVVDDGVQQRLHALVLEGRAAQDRIEGARQHRLADALLDGFFRRLVAFQVGFHRLVVELDGVVDQVLTRFIGLGLEVGGDFLVAEGRAQAVVVPDHRLHADQVDQARQVGFGADRELDRHGLGAQTVADRLDRLVEVGADLVHLVDEDDARNLVLVGLTPDGLGLRLDAGVAVQHRHGAVEHAQRTLDFNGEVHVAGGVDDVEALLFPEGGRRGGRDGDAAFLLLVHPVHGGGAVVDFADLVGLAGVIQDPLGRRRLARVDVGHDAEVAVVFDFMRAGHESVPWGLWRTPGRPRKCRIRRRGRFSSNRPRRIVSDSHRR